MDLGYRVWSDVFQEVDAIFNELNENVLLKYNNKVFQEPLIEYGTLIKKYSRDLFAD